MEGEAKELWMVLCEQVVVEQDPDRFARIVKEINQLLEAKAARLSALRRLHEPPTPASPDRET